MAKDARRWCAQLMTNIDNQVTAALLGARGFAARVLS
jgi:hypothetical protein